MACGQGGAHALLRETLADDGFLNFRPSKIAAAVVYAERRARGAIPFWPSVLAKMTRYEDMTSHELSLAIKARPLKPIIACWKPVKPTLWKVSQNPFWPSVLAKMTRYEDMTSHELSLAIKARPPDLIHWNSWNTPSGLACWPR